MKPVVQGRFVIFVDKLKAQVADEFKQAVVNAGGVCLYGLPSATDIWQPVDAGYAELLKVKVKQEHYKWLDSEENADKWYGIDNFKAPDRRILLMHRVGETYKTLLHSKYDKFRSRRFENTGCLLASDGTGDHLVTPKGLPNYKVPPPTMIELHILQFLLFQNVRFKITTINAVMILKVMMKKMTCLLRRKLKMMETFLIFLKIDSEIGLVKFCSL